MTFKCLNCPFAAIRCNVYLPHCGFPLNRNYFGLGEMVSKYRRKTFSIEIRTRLAKNASYATCGLMKYCGLNTCSGAVSLSRTPSSPSQWQVHVPFAIPLLGTGKVFKFFFLTRKLLQCTWHYIVNIFKIQGMNIQLEIITRYQKTLLEIQCMNVLCTQSKEV